MSIDEAALAAYTCPGCKRAPGRRTSEGERKGEAGGMELDLSPS
jgi:hypothetical protein